MIKRVKKIYTNLDTHTAEVLQKSFSSTFVKAAGMIVGLGVSVFLGRTLEADGLGIINLSNRIVNIVLIIVLLGMRQVIIKEVAIAHNKGNYQHIGNVMHTAYWLNGGIAFVFSVILILVSPWLSNHFFHEPRLTYPLMIMLVVITPQVFSRIFSSGLVGYRKIWQSNLVDQTLSIAVTGLILFLLWIWKNEITVVVVAVCYAIGRIVVTIFVGIYWKSLYHHKSRKSFITKKLLRTSIPLLFVSAALILSSSVDTVMIGWLKESKDVGLYNVALKIAFLTIFFRQITNAAIMPKIAALYESNKINELKKMVNNTTILLFAIGLIFVVITIIFGRMILSFWGEEFKQSYSVLIILEVGQFINLGLGPIANLLIMTDNEKILQNITVITLAINILLNYILIIKIGIIGAAIATTLTITLNLILSAYYVKIKIGFLPIIN